MTSSNIHVGEMHIGGNVEGSIIIGNNNKVETHNYHGTVIKQEALPTQRRASSPMSPRKPIGFVGRKLELQQLEESIASRTPVVVYGLDGIGKTSLVKQAANGAAAKSQQDGVLFLEGLDEAGKLLGFDDLVQRMFNALFESQPLLKVDLPSARTHLSNTKPLVLLNSVSIPADNLDQLLDLFPEAPILIATESTDTSENYETISLGPMAQEDSLNLLVERSKSNDREILAQIATLLENIPAALTVVANVISKKGLVVQEALRRLQSYTSSEKDKTKAALNRAFNLIFSTLTEEERGMLLQAAASPAISTERKWLESVSGGSTVSNKLEELQLLQANSPRLRLMPGLRSFLAEGNDLSEQRERLLSYLLSELQTRWNDFEFIKDELGNVLGLLAWAAANGQWANVAALGRGIDPYLTLRGLWGAWSKTLGEVQRAAKALQDVALTGWVLHQLGTYEFGMGNVAAARKFLEEAISIRKTLGDNIGAAYSQHNLQIITPVVAPQAQPKPATGPGKLLSWVLGGLAVLAIGAFVVLNALGANQLLPATEPVVAASEAKVVLESSQTPTATLAPTQTPIPSATTTVTLTLSPTDPPTLTPTYAVLTNIVVNELADVQFAGCFHGPGTLYLNKGTGRISGNEVDLLGRIETDKGIWVHTRFSLPRTDASDPCWMDAKFLEITEEQLMSVQSIDPANPDEYKLPTNDRNSAYGVLQDPVVTGAVRTGDSVTVSWQFYDVGEGEYPNHNEKFYRYLIEAWLCKAGEIVFTPSGWGPYGPDVVDGITVSANLQDEAGCTEPSHARLYLAWAHGYIGPVEIRPWPQNP
jgi:hypothetical protein